MSGAKRYSWPEIRPAFQLTERDLELLYLVHRYRFARSTHLSQLVHSPHNKVSGRLKLLFRAQYLVRPAAQITYFRAGGGTDPIAFGLANEGAHALRHLGLDVAKVDWTEKNKAVRPEFLAHALAVTDFRVALQLSVRNWRDIQVSEEPELLASLQTVKDSTTDPFTMRPRLRKQGDTIVVPVRSDCTALLSLPDGTRRGFFVEVDRGTMPISRSSLAGSSIVRKLLAYDAAHEQRLHTIQLEWRTFRVLVVTTSADRMAHARTAAASAPLKHPNLFLFADRSCLASRDLLRHPFCDHAGQALTLIPPGLQRAEA